MWGIYLILRNQHIILMLWIKTTHVFTVSNNAAVGIGDDHFFRISTRLDGLRNVLADGVACRISVNGVKTRVVWLWRLSIIERIWLQVMPTWRSFIHICNLILIFLIIWRLNCLRDTINKFILLRKHKQKLKKQKKTYLLDGLFTHCAAISLAYLTLVLVVLSGVAGATASDIVSGDLWPSTINEFRFPLLLCLVNIGLSISFRNLLFHRFSAATANGRWFCGHRLLLIFFNWTSFFLRNTMLILGLFDDLNSCVLRKKNHLTVVSLTS